MSAADRILAALARRSGGRLLDKAVRGILPDKPVPVSRGGNIFSGVAGALAMRIATRSVPGAIVVASGALAKKLYDRRRERRRSGGQKTPPTP